MMTPLFSLQGVSFAYPGGRKVFDGVDFDLYPGDRVAVIGANGVGKTTLLHLMVGLRKPTTGSIIAFGAERRQEADFREVRARAGLLFQDADDQLFCPTVLEDVAFGPLNLGQGRREAMTIAERTLAALGLSGFGDRITHKLSGGEKRLVTLAAVLAMQPEVLLLDEPTNGLDAAADARLVEYLRSLPQALLFVSHDERLIERLAHRAVVLCDGRLHTAHVHVHQHAHTHAHPQLRPNGLPQPNGELHPKGMATSNYRPATHDITGHDPHGHR
jgi:cobalt/nickel transport system ATP-binding protein